MNRRTYDPGQWNLIAVAEPGTTGAALSALGGVGRFRSTPYPGVLVGDVGPGDAVSWLHGVHVRRPQAFSDVLRVVPLESTIPFDRDDVTEALCCALEAEYPRLAGRSFHVRARLRGLKGRVETQALERAVGAFLYGRCERLDRPARVRFEDPDLVVAVQVLGRQVGYALLDRAIRRLSLVRPR